MDLVVVCRGSVRDGLGHLFRAQTFAAEAQARHRVTLIAIAPDQLAGVLNIYEGEIVLVEDESAAANHIDMADADIVVFDLTELAPRTFERIRSVARACVSLSPVFNLLHRVDLAVFRSRSTPDIPGQVLAGLQYAILGRMGERIPDELFEHQVSEPHLSVGVCMGGADASNKTLSVLASLDRWDDPATFWVILGEGYQHSYDQLMDCVRKRPAHEVLLIKTNRSIWRLLRHCALGIFTGGLSTVEAVHAGLPSVNVFDNEEQIHTVAPELFEAGACMSAGLLSDGALSRLPDALSELHRDRSRLRQVRAKSAGLVDGMAAQRVLAEIEKLDGDGGPRLRRPPQRRLVTDR